jgi:GrpB-like predicted nucleotidyltransferase (UPF0157 family)
MQPFYQPAGMPIFRSVTSSDVLELLDRLDAAGIEWWVDGGWGVDALLGYETRPHDDLDLAVPAAAIERLPEVFPEFRHVHEHHLPSAYVLQDSRGRQLDFHPLAIDDEGNGWQPQADGPPALWPREALEGRGSIRGREVRCTSPEFQVQAHLYEGYDDVDWAAIESLSDHFGLPLPPGRRPGFVLERRTVRVAPMTERQLAAIRVGATAGPTTGRVELAPYDPEWPRLFEREADWIRGALGKRAIRIEHTGSTSVPGLAAKPIIDVTLVVEDTTDEEAYVPALEAAGYVLRMREPDWYEHRLFKGPDTNVNLHVFSEGCEEIERMVRFRDWLRSNDADRELYLRTKRELAASDWKFVQNYADAKSAVVQEILGRALKA